jgi:hypothetical protein
LLAAALEPATASCAQDGWLFELRHAQDRTVEFARSCFAPLGRGDLDMIYAFDAWTHARQNITGRNRPSERSPSPEKSPENGTAAQD